MSHAKPIWHDLMPIMPITLYSKQLVCSIWIQFELQGPLGGPAARIEFKCFVSAPFRKSSNGRKIARMARNLTIFGPNRSRRRELNFEKFSNERANEQTNDLYKKFSKNFRKFFENFGGKPEASIWIIVRDFVIRYSLLRYFVTGPGNGLLHTPTSPLKG